MTGEQLSILAVQYKQQHMLC